MSDTNSLVGYKHVLPEWASAFENGTSLQVGSLVHYRTMEGPRGDPQEGQATTLVDRYSNANARRSSDTVLYIPGLIYARGPGVIEINNSSSVTSVPNRYLFCVSDRIDESLVKQGQRVYKICDMNAFAAALIAANATLGHFVLRRVTYRTRTANYVDSGPVCADPFLKDPAFQHEHEIRVLFDHIVKDSDPPTMIINAPKASVYIERVS